MSNSTFSYNGSHHNEHVDNGSGFTFKSTLHRNGNLDKKYSKEIIDRCKKIIEGFNNHEE